MPSQILTFKQTAAALSEASEEHRVNNDGKVSQIVMHFPPGCSGLVDVRLRYFQGTMPTNLFPSQDEQYIALDAATPNYSDINFTVKHGDTVKMEVKNYDGLNSHTISSQVVIVGAE